MKSSSSLPEVKRSILAFIRSTQGSARARRALIESFIRGQTSAADFDAALSRLNRSDWTRADRELNESDKAGIHLLSVLDTDYPPQLRAIPDPPALLSIQGNIDAITRRRKAVAIVGTRRCSSSAAQIAFDIAEAASAGGVLVVSGLARGIDTAVHRGAIRGSKGSVAPSSGVAVLGAGLNQIYPAENQSLVSELVATGGAIVSEYALNEGPRKFHFPERNRIISGLSQAVLVVEAGEKSGAMVTANIAAEQGREVYAIPGDVRRTNCLGTNKLIRAGAQVILHQSDLLALLGVRSKKNASATIESRAPILTPSLSPLGKRIAELLEREGELNFDQIVRMLDVTTPELNVELSNLALDGIVQAEPGAIYSLCW